MSHSGGVDEDRNLEAGLHVAETGDQREVAELIVRVVPRLYRQIVGEVCRAPGTAGMSLAQFRALARLRVRDYRAAELAEALEMGRPALTVMINSLERQGFVERLRDIPFDRRSVRIHLTPAGRTLHRRLHAHALASTLATLGGLSHSERLHLARGLKAVEQTLGRPGRAAGVQSIPGGVA